MFCCRGKEEDRVDVDMAQWAYDWCARHAHIVDGYVAAGGDANQIRVLDQLLYLSRRSTKCSMVVKVDGVVVGVWR